MGSKGPSPLVPLLMVGVLSLVIFGPLMLSITETLLPLLPPWGESEGGITVIRMLVPIVLLLLIHYLTVFTPRPNIFSAANWQRESSVYDGDGFGFGFGFGFGLGSLLVVVLFFILYHFI
ncbi:hypothetical protein Acr_15g0013010 [Actinidia rufa]|uniref:Transmembrane protein n=1 Tax=Actinidia rufa TaxID=165716 RepID=A0A7J0FVG6_9ERIC|nr:hypothetical protein Acr_15g0013010 [Actinidia rufa]